MLCFPHVHINIMENVKGWEEKGNEAFPVVVYAGKAWTQVLTGY